MNFLGILVKFSFLADRAQLKNRGLSLGIVQKDILLDVTIMIMTIPIIFNHML